MTIKIPDQFLHLYSKDEIARLVKLKERKFLKKNRKKYTYSKPVGQRRKGKCQ